MPRLFFFLPLFTLLTSCSVIPPKEPNLPHTQQESAYIPPSYCLIASDHVKIPIRLYLPPHHAQPRAVILALHGFGDSRDAWENLAPALTKENILIAAPDARGFGEAPPAYQWSNNKRLLQDNQEEMTWLHHLYPQTPLYLLGESMGAAEALLLNTHKNPLYLRGTILLSAAIMKFSEPLPTFLSLWNLFTPHLIFTGKDAPGPRRIATTNLSALRRFYFDPLTQHYTQLNALNGLVSLMSNAYDAVPYAHLPLLVIYGDHDDFISKENMTLLFQRLPSKTRFDIIPYGHHLLSREKNNIAADIISWIKYPNKFLPSGGDFTAMSWQISY